MLLVGVTDSVSVSVSVSKNDSLSQSDSGNYGESDSNSDSDSDCFSCVIVMQLVRVSDSACVSYCDSLSDSVIV